MQNCGFSTAGHPSLVSNCGSVKPCESQPPPSSLLSVFVSYCISAVYFTVFPALKKRSIQTGWLPFLLVWPGTPQLPTVRNSSIQESGRLSINKQQVSWITPCGRYSLLVGGGAGVVNCLIRWSCYSSLALRIDHFSLSIISTEAGTAKYLGWMARWLKPAKV